MYISSMVAPKNKSIIIWERNGKKRVRKELDPDFSFYIKDDENESQYEDIYGNKVQKVEFDNYKDYDDTKKTLKASGIQTYEADITLDSKALLDNYYNAEVADLYITFLDIEVDYDKNIGFSKVEAPYAPINSVALYNYYNNTRVLICIPPQYSPYAPTEKQYTLDDIDENILDSCEVIFCENEKELLEAFLKEIKPCDILCGFNSDFFDIPYIYKRVKTILGDESLKKLCFPKSKMPYIKTVKREITKDFIVEDELVTLHGRMSVDFQRLYKKFTQENKASYALSYIAEDELPEMRKLEYRGSLYDLYRNDFSYFLQYNIIDTEILVELEQKLQYIKLAIELSRMACCNVTQVYGTIKVAESAIINYCHHVLNKIVPDAKDNEYSKFQGAFVLPTKIGEHTMIGSIDVESLYPTGIMCINASPETLIGQFKTNEGAYNALVEDNNELLEFKYETGKIEKRTTNQWKEFFKEQNYTISGYGTVFDQNERGIIPVVLDSWFSERKEYKKELAKYKDIVDKLSKDDKDYKKMQDKRDFYYRFQYIKKIQLNSLYGCMGNRYFKFYDIRLAESTTRTGREILFHIFRQVGKELDGEYKFPTPSIVAGDTDSSYFKTHTDNLEDAKIVCKHVTDSVNNSFPKFMQTHFFCNEDTSKRVRVENEIIADIGIFASKKIYLLHLVHKEGYDVDEEKIMGHAIKKTVVTKRVKTALKNIISDYFKNHDWKQLNKNVVKFKNEMLETDIVEDYGLPRKVNKVEEYTNNFENDPNTRLPGGQAASIFWNICKEAYNDKESPPITSQMAIRVYNLEEPFGRFKTIAVPADLEELPQWFTEHFVPSIDKELQVEKLVDDTLRNICNAVGREIPTEKEIIADRVLVY